jgi:phospholipid transport system substrate-binding protein
MRVILFLIVLSAASSGRTDLVGAVEPGSTPLPAMPAGEDVEGDAPAVTGDGVDSDPKDAPYGNAANGLAVDVVKQLNVSLQEVLENAKQLGYQGRVERLSPILDAAFDFNYMAAKSVGRHWSTLSPDEQKRWVEVFAVLTKATYAGRFNRFTGQVFEFVDEQPGANGSVVIRSKVVSPGEDDVDLSYRLSKRPAAWKVIDVYYNGTVSELALRRADYSSVLKRDGFAALIARVNEKISELSAGGTP